MATNYQTSSVSGNNSQSSLSNGTVIHFQFSLSNPVTRATYISLYTVNFLLTIFGNLTMIAVIALSKRMRNTTNLFLLNLAIADFMQGLICIVPGLMNQITYNWIYGEFPCKLMRFSAQFSYSASVFLMLAVAMERYRILMNPLMPSSQRVSESLLFFRISTAIAWTSACTIAFPKFLFAETRHVGVKGFCVYHPKFNLRVYNLFNFICLYVLPLTLLCIVYGRIIRILSKSISFHNRGTAKVLNVHYSNGFCQVKESMMGSNCGDCKNDSRPNSSGSQTDTSQQGSQALSFDPRFHSANATKSSILLATGRTDESNNRSGDPNSRDSMVKRFNCCNNSGLPRNCCGGLVTDRQVSNLDPRSNVNIASNNRVIRSRLRVIHLLLTITVIFAILVLPYHLRLIIVDNFRSIYVPFEVGPASILLFNLQTAFNPLIYISCSHKFRKALTNLLCNHSRCKSAVRLQHQRQCRM